MPTVCFQPRAKTRHTILYPATTTKTYEFWFVIVQKYVVRGGAQCTV